MVVPVFKLGLVLCGCTGVLVGPRIASQSSESGRAIVSKFGLDCPQVSGVGRRSVFSLGHVRLLFCSSVWMPGDSRGFGYGWRILELAMTAILAVFFTPSPAFYLADVMDCNLCNLPNINELSLVVMDCEFSLNVSIILHGLVISLLFTL